jgi:fumarylacetoacetase
MSLTLSWVASANTADTDFPLNNLPCGVYSMQSHDRRCGVAIGDSIVDIGALERSGLLELAAKPVFTEPHWNTFMALGPDAWKAFRHRLTALLAAGSAARARIEHHLVPQADAIMHLPFVVAEFTDFYSSRHHAERVGTMFRGPANALPPNWLHMPIGYNGRASSVVVSATDVRRPLGQLKAADAEAPHFGPSQRFDFELEMGAIVGQPSEGLVSVAEADAMIFGYVLLNDWSARDIQAWEYQPLGPFQAKATATSLSPWIVMQAALEPFRAGASPRERPLLPYLREPGPMLYDVQLEVGLAPPGQGETVITRTNLAELYYSAAQQLCHHTTSGCAMRIGDVLGSGTVSGPAKDGRGCLLELSCNGKKPIRLDTGETRSFLEDGDRLTLRGHAQGDGYRIGFGECTGRVLPAQALPPWAR